jgi:hypothetical protein
MGIDIYLKWNSMSEGDKQSQYAGFSTTAGSTGYLRESYHGGPYATKILCREAFEAENFEAQIPASVLRERLTHVTEPVRGANGGHNVAAMFFALMKNTGATIEGSIMSDTTCPMTVEEAVRERYARLYPDEPPEHVEEVVQSYRDFVALAEKMEAENGEPCTIYASY